MAIDLPTTEANLLEALVKNSKRGIRSYTQGGRTIVYESLKELLEAFELTRTLQPSRGASANAVEVLDI